ncbi:MAG: glycosyltransferase family 39 protein [Anaerolineae bacterium]|nr:glycosyltransferase family 39 protein [Anaerolineae bacterium]
MWPLARRGDGGGATAISPDWVLRVLWFGVVFAALSFRAVEPAWDGGIAAHPDERFLLGAAQNTPLLGNVCRANPQFPYGQLAVTLAQILLVAAPGADPLFAARLVSALVGVILVVLAGACARELAGPRAGPLGALLAALAPGLIQQAHFYTVDPLGAALASGSVLAAARGRWRIAGALTGLAVACKASLAVGAVPLIVLAAIAPQGHPRGVKLGGMLGWRAFRFCGPAVVAFVFASPWAVMTPVACWQGPLVQSMLVSGRYVLPYTQQYLRTTPILYPLQQMALWGLGPGVVLLGAVALVMRVGRGFRKGSIPTTRAAYLLPSWLWVVTLLLVIGSLQVKFPRYLLPLYPWWIGWAVTIVVGDGPARARDLGRRSLGVILVLTTGLLGLAQVGVYVRPHPWVAASRWLYANVDAGATIAVEAWDHPLPVPLPDRDPAVHTQVTLPVYEGAGGEAPAWLGLASNADVVAIASRRAYGTLSREPETYGAVLAWYADLFARRSLTLFARCPHVGPLSITDDPLADAGLPVAVSLAARCGTPLALRLPHLDESYRVYDAPLTLLLIRERE